MRESLETPGQTAALITPSEDPIGRVRHALAQWGLGDDACADAGGPDSLAARAVSCAASGKPGGLVELLRQAPQGEGAAKLLRAAEIVDVGVLRQMWRPSALEGVPAALSRAEHAISSGEARHPAMKRIGAAEWDAARSLASALIEALSPLMAPAKRTPLPDWLALHRTALSQLASLGFSSGESPALVALEQAAAHSFALDLAEYAEFFAQVVAARRAKVSAHPHPHLFIWKPLDARLLSADVVVLAGLNRRAAGRKCPDPIPGSAATTASSWACRPLSAASAVPRTTSWRLPLRRRASSSHAPKRKTAALRGRAAGLRPPGACGGRLQAGHAAA